ncbi:MAG: hypothetical protein AAF892_10290 [Cyanobacteria bacterium P01_D01_bin.71]
MKHPGAVAKLLPFVWLEAGSANDRKEFLSQRPEAEVMSAIAWPFIDSITMAL